MGIPDTYTMPIPHYGTFAVEESSSTQDNQDQEQMASCTQLFCTALLLNKTQEQLNPSVPLKRDSSNMFTSEYIQKATNIKKFSRVEIKATLNYSKDNILGRGGFGTVYKGILPSNQVVAVKRPSGKKSTQLKNEFVNDIIILSQINNRNIVQPLGCCFETEVPSIVYEYIPNGNLHDHLFDKQKPCFLIWNHRLSIAVQVAQVLEYLHTTIRVPTIHRDIKPSNILLDEKYMAKVSDFGISKLGTDQDKVSFGTVAQDTLGCDSYTTTCVVGALGYLAPEYALYRRPSPKNDVYSFDIILVELLMRKRLWYVDKVVKEEGNLHSNVLTVLKDDRLIEILDEQLVNEGSMEQLKKVANLAGRCLEMNPEVRPPMRQVVRELQNIKDSDF